MSHQIKMVMSSLWDSDLFEKYDVQWMFPIHDECCFSVRRDHAAEVIQQAHQTMLTPFLEGLPSASSIGIGKTFGTLVELGEVFDAGKIEETLKDIFDEKEALAA